MSLKVEIEKSRRKRSIGFSVRWPDTLVVSAPAGHRRADLDKLVAGRLVWAERRLERLRADYGRLRLPKAFQGGETYPYLGEEHVLTVIVSGARTRPKCSFDGSRFTVELPGGAEGGQPEKIRQALLKWYRRQAEEVIHESVARYLISICANPRICANTVTTRVRNQRSRWGSCARSGQINLNWRLVLLPPPLLDYVVWHELCHLAEPNHSPRFWAEVAEGMPDYKSRQRELRRYALYLDEF